jgi:hypothetical protein
VQPAPTYDDREGKIMRQTATKVAAQLLKHLTPDQQTFGNLLSISERLVAYYEDGVQYAQQDPDDSIPF